MLRLSALRLSIFLGEIMKFVKSVVFGGAVALLSITGANAATYANTPNGQIFSMGYPDTTSYGQTFSAPGGDLLNWTFYLTGGNSGSGRFVIADWDGSKAVGPELFNSSFSYAGGVQSVSFSGINLGMLAGNDYIAYMTIAGVDPDDAYSSVSVSGSSDDDGLGGEFRFLNSSGVDPLSLDNVWNSWSVSDMQFSAEFGVSQVPEPAMLSLLGLALFGLIGTRSRKSV